MDLEPGPTCFGNMNPQPSPPSHRTPLTLLSKLKRQLSKSPATRHRRRHSNRQPIEHQYLPIPTVAFPESLRSNRAQSTYSCSNHSSSASSFVFIDHNEEPESFGADEYRPFLPLIIQHERRLAAVAVAPPVPPPLLQTRKRFSLSNEPPSPTSTASSKSPVTPTHFFRTDEEDVDEIMTLASSEVGSISEYSLPRSLSAYMEQGRARSIRSRRATKSSCEASNSEPESPPRRKMSIRVSFFLFFFSLVPN